MIGTRLAGGLFPSALGGRGWSYVLRKSARVGVLFVAGIATDVEPLDLDR
jgi:hypothetical protein